VAETEVKTKLTLDDVASSVLGRIREGFTELNEKRETTQQGFSQFAKTFASQFAAINLMPAIRQMSQFASGILDVARAADDAAQNIGGFLAGTAGYTWPAARAEGERLHKVVLDMAVDIGQASDDIERGVQGLMTWMGGGQRAYEVATGQMRNMTQIANVMGLSVTKIGMGVGQMAAGFIQTRSPMFALLRGTGIFAENINDITKEWRLLTEEERIGRLEGALHSVAKNLEAAAPTMSDMVTSMKEAGKMLVEAFGMPLINELKPVFESVTQRIRGAREEIGAFAKTMGRDVGRWVQSAGDTIQKGFEFIKSHGDEIKEAIVSGFENAKAVVQWIIENRELIAIAFGARVAAPAIGAAASVGGAVFKAGAAGGAGAGMLGAGGGAMALGAFAVAIAGAGLAVEQFTLLLKDVQTEEAKDAEARRVALVKMSKDFTRWDEEQSEAFGRIGQAFVDSAESLDMTQAQAKAFVQGLRESRIAGEFMARQVDDAARRIEAISIGAADIGGVEKAEELQAQGDVLANAFQEAIGLGNRSSMEYIASMLDDSAELRDAFLKSSDMTQEGFDKMASMLVASAKDFRNRVVSEVSEISWQPGAFKGAKPKAPSISMSGGQTFNIKQDFRDADPDRVLIAFRRDMAASATRRIQARGASPFGT